MAFENVHGGGGLANVPKGYCPVVAGSGDAARLVGERERPDGGFVALHGGGLGAAFQVEDFYAAVFVAGGNQRRLHGDCGRRCFGQHYRAKQLAILGAPDF